MVCSSKRLRDLWWWQQCNLKKLLSSFKFVISVPTSVYIVTIGSLTQYIYPAWKTIVTIWQNIKARELQKSQFPNYLVNWKKLGSIVRAIISKSQFSIFSMNREILRVPIFHFSISLWIVKKIEVQSMSKIQRTQIWMCRRIQKSYVLIWLATFQR